MAGDILEHSCGSARCDNHGVAAELGYILYLGVELDLDAELLHLSAIPGQQVTKPALVALRRRGDKGAAEHAGLLIYNGGMASELGNTGNLHAADAAADDMYGLGRRGLFDIMLIPLHHLSIDGAP